MEIPYTFLLLMVSVPTLAFNDEFMSCDIYLESKRTARVLDHIPCDMSRQSFCEHKGAAYPEAAIWRFKEENRALMKRLYGDMDSTTVYREMRGFSMNIISDHGMFPNHEYNIRVGSGLATVQSAREQIEPSERSQSKMKRKVIKRKKIASSNISDQNPSAESVKVIISTTSSSSSVRVSSSASPPTATPTAPPATVEGIFPMTATEAAITYTTNAANTDETTLSLEETRLPETVIPPETEVTTQESKDPQQEVSPNPYTAQEYTVQDYTNPDFTVQDFTSEFLAEVDVQELEHIVGQILPDKQQSNPEPVDQSQPEGADQHYQYHQDYSAHEYDDVEYQDVYEDHHYEQKIEYTGTSVNACPVKEEVFAPYWANNTRDQVLALLNLYPFEQYIHMETCKFENEEIMCRPGCRCEQQFRLHRLLAFDPNNECRGIFSDWFRFPSYCICKCYNMNEELFVRHPRKEEERPQVEPKIEPEVESEPEVDTQEKVEEVANGLDGNKSHRETKDAKFRSFPHPPLIQNIPAFLPYEAKQALLHAMNNPSQASQSKGEKKIEEKRPRENRGDDSFDQHFFYGNEPILHYKLADNSEGTVRKTPRR